MKRLLYLLLLIATNAFGQIPKATLEEQAAAAEEELIMVRLYEARQRSSFTPLSAEDDATLGPQLVKLINDALAAPTTARVSILVFGRNHAGQTDDVVGKASFQGGMLTIPVRGHSSYESRSLLNCRPSSVLWIEVVPKKGQ